MVAASDPKKHCFSFATHLSMGETDEINFSASKERLLPSSLSRHEDENVEQIRKPRPRKYFWALVLRLGLSLMLNVGLLGHLFYKA